MYAALLSAAGTAISAAIAAAAVLIVAGVLVFHFIRKKQGKTGCGCDCPSCSRCNKNTKK